MRCAPIEDYVVRPEFLPRTEAARWYVLNCVRQHVRDGRLLNVKPRAVNRFLRSLAPEQQLTILTDWSSNGANWAPTAPCSRCLGR